MNPTFQGPYSTIRGLLLTGAAIVLCSLFVTPARASERWETLEAIHWVENPHDSARPGPFGELGAYQFRQSTWLSYTTAPFSRAVDRQTSDDVAIKHYEWLKRGLVRNGVAVTPYNIALAWNGGLTATVRGSVPASARDYAERVTNVVTELRQGRVATNR
jgi:hypothetical protein